MKNIQLQFNERHLSFAFSLLSQYTIERYFDTVLSIKTAVKANANPDAILTVQVPVEAVKEIYTAQSNLPEGYAKTINEEMEAVLLPQLVAASNAEQAELAASSTPETVDLSVSMLLQDLQTFNADKVALLNENIAKALASLKR